MYLLSELGHICIRKKIYIFDIYIQKYTPESSTFTLSYFVYPPNHFKYFLSDLSYFICRIIVNNIKKS